MDNNNLFDRAEYLLRIKDYNNLLSLESELKEYAQSCSDNDRDLCSIYLKNIKVIHSLKKIEQQQRKLKDFIISWNNTGTLKLEYIEPYGNSFGVTIEFADYAIEIVYLPANGDAGNEIHTSFYFNDNGLYKQFNLNQSIKRDEFRFLDELKEDYYSQKVTYGNWADFIIEAITIIEKRLDVFQAMCNISLVSLNYH